MLGRIISGLVVVLVGVGLLLDAAGTIEFGDAVSIAWPLVVVAVGIGLSIARPRQLVAGAVLIGVGLVFFARNVGWLAADVMRYAWPVAVILIGLLILAPRIRRSAKRDAGPRAPNDPDSLRIGAYFAGAEETVRSRAFRGGRVDVAFGGAKIDLRGAGLATEGARLQLSAVFGGIDVLVPTDWAVVVNARPILGGIENKTTPIAPTGASGPALHIDATASFAGITVKN